MSTWQADVARARWRADLLEYGAASLEAIGSTQMAESTMAKAEAQRAYAKLIEDFETARDHMDYSTIEYGRLRDRFAEARRMLRESGLLATDASITRNFAEPSDDELLGMTS